MNLEASRHLDQATLGSYALGDLPTCQVKKVEHHLSHCAYCRADLRTMEELVFAAPRLTFTTGSQTHCTA